MSSKETLSTSREEFDSLYKVVDEKKSKNVEISKDSLLHLLMDHGVMLEFCKDKINIPEENIHE